MSPSGYEIVCLSCALQGYKTIHILGPRALRAVDQMFSFAAESLVF